MHLSTIQVCFEKKYFVIKAASYIKYHKITGYACIMYLLPPKLGINGMISDICDCNNKDTSVGLSCSKGKKARSILNPSAK